MTRHHERLPTRFPERRSHAVWLQRTADGWLVLAYGHGWLHSSERDALDDARWLARNFGFPIHVCERAA
jgi:hypothetical protein